MARDYKSLGKAYGSMALRNPTTGRAATWSEPQKPRPPKKAQAPRVVRWTAYRIGR